MPKQGPPRLICNIHLRAAGQHKPRVLQAPVSRGTVQVCPRLLVGAASTGAHSNTWAREPTKGRSAEGAPLYYGRRRPTRLTVSVHVRLSLLEQHLGALQFAGPKSQPAGRVAVAVLRVHIRLLQQLPAGLRVPSQRSQMQWCVPLRVLGVHVSPALAQQAHYGAVSLCAQTDKGERSLAA